MNLRDYIHDVPDFPKPGILFKDIGPLLMNPEAKRFAFDQLHEQWRDVPYDKVVGFDSRGFLFGVPVSERAHVGFVPARKKGKLPGHVTGVAYGLEYGNDALEIQSDKISPGDRILFIDDLLATGGTTRAGILIVEQLGAEVVGCGYVIELTNLPGRALLTERLSDDRIRSLIQFGDG